MKTNPNVSVVMVPLLAQGHLNQLLHLSHLLSSYGLSVHFVGSSAHNRQAKLRLHGWDSETLTQINFHDFELPPYNSPPPKIDPSVPFPDHFVPLFEASATYLRQPVAHLLNQMSSKFNRVNVIHDVIMSYVVQDAKHIPNVETYVFNPISVFTSFTNAWQNIPDKEKPFELEDDLKDTLESLPTNEGCATREIIEFVMKQRKLIGFESGNWIHNTSRVIEGRFVNLFETLSLSKSQTKHFTLGPFNPVAIDCGSRRERHQCLEWLDKQEEGSVLYVSFGSTTSLTDEQIIELAKGLENCGEKFIWVLRRADPNDVFGEVDKVRKPQLPQGYEERVKDRGLIVRDWAPQLEILGHPSTGGFMSHCGWNSCMESTSMGVAIAAWPMHSDQPRNASLVSKVLRVGIVVRDWEQRGELVKSSTIENAVKFLMVSEKGKEVKKRAKELGKVVRESVDEGGLSCLERDSFIAHICR